MAKRKKNRMRDETMAPEEIGSAQGKFRDLMEDLAKKVESMNFATEEALSEFLNSEMTGKTLSEISAELGKLRSDEPETPSETANRFLLALPSDSSYEEMTARARRRENPGSRNSSIPVRKNPDCRRIARKNTAPPSRHLDDGFSAISTYLPLVCHLLSDMSRDPATALINHAFRKTGKIRNSAFFGAYAVL